MTLPVGEREGGPQGAAAGRGAVPWGPEDVLLGCLLAALLFGVLTGLSLAAGALLPLSDRAAAAVEFGADLTVPVAALTAPVLVLVPWRGGTSAHLGLRTFPLRRVWLIPLVLLADCALAVAYFLAVGAAGLFSAGNPEAPGAGLNPATAGLLDAAAGVALAPVSEELFFRGFMFAGLVQRWGAGWAALASALLFSVVHLDSSVLVPFVVGAVLLAYLYRWSGSLWFPILAHAGYNAVVTAATW